MELVELTEFIVKSLVTDKECVSVKEFPSDSDNTMIIQVLISEEDMGRVIGKSGKTAHAIRTLVQASSSIKDRKSVKINIDSF